MKKLLSILALAALVAGIPAGALAAKPKATPTPAPGATPSATPSAAPAATPAATPAASEKHIPMYSEVSALDASAKSWTHKNKDGKEVKFQVTDKTEIKQGEQPAKFEDIKVGDWVSGSRIKKSDTEYEVVKITKFGPKEEKSAKGAKAAKATPAAK